MNVLLIDQENMFLDFALRCVEADHAVKWHQDARRSRDGEGFRGFEKVDDWRAHMKWAKDGLIICSGNCKHMRELDRYRDLGFKIFGPTQRSAELEIKRSVGMEAMQAAGIDIPHYETFKSLEDASKFARKADQCYVFKTLGDEDDKSLTFVSCDPAEMVGWIDRQIKRGMKLKGPCMLQEKIDMLAEVGVAGWIGPRGFVPDLWELSFEHKKLMNGEIGPQTGEMGTVVQRVKSDPLADMLKALEGEFLKRGHSGDISIGCGIDSKGKAWPFEFTMRCGWPAFFIQTASVTNRDPAKWMSDLLDGEASVRMSYDAALGVVMAQPKFPYAVSKPEDVEGNPISGMEDDDDAIHPIGVMIGKGPKMNDGNVIDGPIPQTTGEYVMCVTGLGKTVSKARDKVYESVDGIKFPNAMFRTDIGEKVQETLPALHELGYALEMQP